MKKIFLPLLFIANISFGQVDLNLGLRAYYPFTGNANDISGNNNNPIFNNATLTADRFGNPNSAYHFDGASTYMKILNSASLNTTNKLSLVAWVKPQGFYPGTCHGNSILMKGDADFLTGNYLLRYDDNAFLNSTQCSVPVDPLHQNFYGGGLVMPPPGYTPYIQTNQWYSVIATYDGTTARLYINCQLILSRTQGGATFTNAADLYLGKFNSGAFPYWVNGDMDEIRIYDRALNIDEVNTLGGCIVQTACNNWLNTPTPNSNARIGDLDISGNQLTIEASFNRTGPVNPVGGYGFLVSKHTNGSNLNYALWPQGCSVSTTNGQYFAQENCTFQLNKTYHVAMVYDGVTLKYYQNGFLHSQTPATGNLILNNLITTIGQNVPEGAPTIFPFIGNMNEVRIWNVARTQSQLQTYMNNSLPNPTTTPGLLGYYTFDNLLNKQGNAAFNATLNGAATINTTNPNCTFIADSCAVIPNNEGCKGVINLHGNDCVRLPLSQDYYANTGFTWETWFNSNWYENNDNTLRLGQSLIISEDATICEDIQLGFGWQTIPRNAIGFVVDGAGTCASRDNNPVFYRPSGGFQPNTWYHVAGVRNYTTNQTQLYFNGLLVDTKNNTGLPLSRNILTRIGTYIVFQDSGFVGKMDEIRIWKTPRTAAEIQANYNKCLTGTEAGLAAYYRSNENSGLVLKNAVNNPALNGTLDATVTRDITINAPLTNNCGLPITTTINITICRGLSYGGHSTSGTYIDTFPAVNGCDSIRTLNLTILTNIDSVRINNINSCFTIDFNGLAYTNTSPINNWQWYFGDGGTANTQNTSHTYTGSGIYIVKLVVTDINGCKDSVSKTLTLSNFIADAGSDATICQSSLPATVQLNASAGTTYAWTPTALLNNPSIQNPVATISTATRFYVTITNTQGCTSTDSVFISLASAPANIRYPTLSAFPYQNLQLQARNIGGTGFQWLPNIGLNNNTIANPVFYHSFTQEYTVRINTGLGCIVIDTQLVEIKGKKGIYVPRGFSPNGDGYNDRLYPILVGIKQLNYFKIYNRWGNLIFETTSGRPEDGWNGTFKGKKQPVEAYTWVVEGVDIDNLIIRKNGNTLLLQ